jgi:hypothetical protein
MMSAPTEGSSGGRRPAATNVAVNGRHGAPGLTLRLFCPWPSSMINIPNYQFRSLLGNTCTVEQSFVTRYSVIE